MRQYNLDPRFDIEVHNVKETINTDVFDLEGNPYPAIVELEVNDFQVIIMNVYTTTKKELRAASEDIHNAIREIYKSQEILTN